jgi:hypothetical protein
MDIRPLNKLLDAAMISVSDKAGRERTRLNFANTVAQRFAFLTDFGFSEIESLPTIVRYGKGKLELNVYYGRQSFEVGFQIGHAGKQYSMSEIIRVTDPAAADQYRNAAATTPAELVSAVDRLAGLVSRYGERALRDDPAFFTELNRQLKSWSEAYALEVLAQQLRPKAEAAFREGRYGEAAELYGRIHAQLSPAELKKLDIARQRS